MDDGKRRRLSNVTAGPGQINAQSPNCGIRLTNVRRRSTEVVTVGMTTMRRPHLLVDHGRPNVEIWMPLCRDDEDSSLRSE